MNELHGRWSPHRNGEWPSLVLLSSGRGFLEDGDAPALYSVLHFRFNVEFGRVLVCSEAREELLSNDLRQTEWSEYSPPKFDIEFTLDTFPQTGDALLTFLYAPYPFGFPQFKLISRDVEPNYKPGWRLA